jgi:hypothetical protein
MACALCIAAIVITATVIASARAQISPPTSQYQNAWWSQPTTSRSAKLLTIGLVILARVDVALTGALTSQTLSLVAPKRDGQVSWLLFNISGVSTSANKEIDNIQITALGAGWAMAANQPASCSGGFASAVANYAGGGGGVLTVTLSPRMIPLSSAMGCSIPSVTYGDAGTKSTVAIQTKDGSTVRDGPGTVASFTIAAALGAPTVAPAAGYIGSSITLTGSNFIFPGSCTANIDAVVAACNVVSASQIVVVVGASTPTGGAVITAVMSSSAGTAVMMRVEKLSLTSAANALTVTANPTFSSVAPATTSYGFTLTVAGANFITSSQTCNAKIGSAPASGTPAAQCTIDANNRILVQVAVGTGLGAAGVFISMSNPTSLSIQSATNALTIQCGPGFYGASGATSCTACPAGTYNPNTGSTSAAACIACLAGTYNVNTGSTSAAACIACPAGTYNINTGSSALAAWDATGGASSGCAMIHMGCWMQWREKGAD